MTERFSSPSEQLVGISAILPLDAELIVKTMRRFNGRQSRQVREEEINNLANKNDIFTFMVREAIKATPRSTKEQFEAIILGAAVMRRVITSQVDAKKHKFIHSIEATRRIPGVHWREVITDSEGYTKLQESGGREIIEKFSGMLDSQYEAYQQEFFSEHLRNSGQLEPEYMDIGAAIPVLALEAANRYELLIAPPVIVQD